MSTPRYKMLRALGLFAAVVASLPMAFALDITFPPETATYKPSDLPGYRLVQQNCMTCHSAQYVQYQPPTSPRSYWEATVKKMKKPFGAPFADEDIPAMVDYLVKTYGAERVSGEAVAVASAAPPKLTESAALKPSAGAQINPGALLKANNCTACHAVDQKVVGPAFKDVAAKYAGRADALKQVATSIRTGGAGKWGAVPMPPYPALTEPELEALATWILAR